MPRTLFVLGSYRWCVAGIGVGLLFGIVLVWSDSPLTPPAPGSMQDVFAQVRVGMARDEAVTILKTYDGQIDCIYVSGTLMDGRSFSDLGFNGLPPAAEIDQGVLTLADEYCESVEVVFGPGGIVTAKNYSSDWFLDEWRVRARSLLAGSSSQLPR
jgi:hypothetical protein